MALIECKNLSLGYEGRIIAEGIDLQVNKGDYLCIVGENGSGKTTLMKTMLGLKAASGGSLTYGDGLKKNGIGYLPQQTAAQRDFPASVYEVVLSGCLGKRGLLPFFSAEQKLLAKNNMERLGISAIAEKCYRELSGGQQQRVLLARALCASSELLLLDEPVSGLDPVVTAELYSLISDLNRDGLTVIMISHDIAAAVASASHILHLNNTRTFFGTTEEYLDSDVGRKFAKRTISAINNYTDSINDKKGGKHRWKH